MRRLGAGLPGWARWATGAMRLRSRRGRGAPDTPVPGVTFVGDLHSGLAAAKVAAGDKYVNVLGASTARQCLDAGALDEILVLIAPVLLGDGVRLFDRPGGTAVRLERISLSQAPQATNLWFRVT